MVKFRGFDKLCFSTNTFVGLTDNKISANFHFDTLFDWTMAFLKGDWNDEGVLKHCEFIDY